MSKSDSINELATALSKAQAAMKPAIKDSTNPHFGSKYADLASVWEACREPLTANGLSVVQTIGGAPPPVTVTTMLMHSSGQWISGDFTVMPTKTDPQGAVSAVTYARRAALAAMVGVAPDDDDGNAASAPKPPPPRVIPPAPKPVAPPQLKIVETKPPEVAKAESLYLALKAKDQNIAASIYDEFAPKRDFAGMVVACEKALKALEAKP